MARTLAAGTLNMAANAAAAPLRNEASSASAIRKGPPDAEGMMATTN